MHLGPSILYGSLKLKYPKTLFNESNQDLMISNCTLRTNKHPLDLTVVWNLSIIDVYYNDEVVCVGCSTSEKQVLNKIFLFLKQHVMNCVNMALNATEVLPKKWPTCIFAICNCVMCCSIHSLITGRFFRDTSNCLGISTTGFEIMP